MDSKVRLVEGPLRDWNVLVDGPVEPGQELPFNLFDQSEQHIYIVVHEDVLGVLARYDRTEAVG